jgi:hypothetical protein
LRFFAIPTFALMLDAAPGPAKIPLAMLIVFASAKLMAEIFEVSGLTRGRLNIGELVLTGVLV